MKKINSNIIIFFTAVLIVVFGLSSGELWRSATDCAKAFFANAKTDGIASAFAEFTDEMEKTSTEKLAYHHKFMDINSAVLSAVNTRVVEKDDSTVVKTDSGYLANPRAYISDEELSSRAEKVREVYEASEANGSKFLYVMAPSKGYYMDYPPNTEDFTKSNIDRFANTMNRQKIPFLNLEEYMKNENLTDEDAFFITDHHWKPEFAFASVNEICADLGRRYGFSYRAELGDLSNYSVTTYNDWFLGSQGKKVGKYFTPLGVDDISIILPNFETHMTEEQPNKNLFREGNFSETAMYMENVKIKDLYTLNPYVAYSGGDFREQIITNKKEPDAPTMLLIRDSFGCAAAPFLSLRASRLYIADVRDYAYYVGDKINVGEYIKEKNPDYVIILYNGVSAGSDLFDFN